MRRLFRVPFVRDFAVTGGTQVFKSFGAMVGGILTARALGPSGKGIISVLVALGSMAVMLASECSRFQRQSRPRTAHFESSERLETDSARHCVSSELHCQRDSERGSPNSDSFGLKKWMMDLLLTNNVRSNRCLQATPGSALG